MSESNIPVPGQFSDAEDEKLVNVDLLWKLAWW